MDVLVNAGVYLLEPSVIDLIQAEEVLDMTELMRRVIDAQGRVILPFLLLHSG